MKKDLTVGSVFNNVTTLSLPIIGASFMQLAYNFTDMLWVGKLGSNAVAAVGTAGFFLHFGMALSSVVRMGSGVTVSQAMGAHNEKEAKNLTSNALLLLFAIVLIYVAAIFVFYKPLIGFFELNDSDTEIMAYHYLRLAAVGLFFMLSTRFFTGISNARGDSKFPFKVTTVGVLLNIILDPLFIFVFKLGVSGAAMATIIAQMIVFTLFWFKRSNAFLCTRRDFVFRWNKIVTMLKLGFPPSAQFIIFSLVAMVMGKIVAGFGSQAIAAQKIGLQIEAITFMTVGGLNNGIMSFTGQNFGARKLNRITAGFKVGMQIAVVFGILTTILFVSYSEELVRWFVDDFKTVQIGSDYLKIVGLSQVFMCIDMISAGVINGIGKTKIPASISIVMILFRIPLAIYLSQPQCFGVNGIWYALLISSTIRGLAITTAYFIIKPKALQSGALVSN